MFSFLDSGGQWLIDRNGTFLGEKFYPTSPAAIFGTSIALLEACGKMNPLTLPSGSWIFETGGSKGLDKSFTPAEVREKLSTHFGLPLSRILNEYSMTELSSQFYKWGNEETHKGPPWTAIRIVDLETGLPAPAGEIGYLEIIDLANLDTVSAIRTQDLAIATGELSGNTPHAAFQSVFRAILIGCLSWVKIPSAGLPEFEQWATGIPLLELRRELPPSWKSPEIAIIYGSADTIDFFRHWLSPHTRLIEHGPKLSAAFVFQESRDTYRNLARDIMRYGQRGCLSVQMIYVAGDPQAFCENLAVALDSYPGQNQPTLSEAGAVRNERELTRFRAANGANLRLLESSRSVDWTILLDHEDTTLRPGPLSGFVRVAPMPDTISADTLGPELAYLSTAVVEPLSMAGKLEPIAPPRICPPGRAQEPGIFWHPDGEMPLAGLVRWRDLG
eukprot:g3630.t1